MKNKKKKLDSLPKIRRKLLKLWGSRVRERDGNICVYCGAKNGEPNKFNPAKKTILDSHHLLQKEIKDCPLKYEITNGISLCKNCHKFNGTHSAHKSPIVFYDWFKRQYPERYDFILNNSSLRVDLDNRDILAEIEDRLTKGESLDLERLKQIDLVAKEETKDKIIKGDLFEECP